MTPRKKSTTAPKKLAKKPVKKALPAKAKKKAAPAKRVPVTASAAESVSQTPVSKASPRKTKPKQPRRAGPLAKSRVRVEIEPPTGPPLALYCPHKPWPKQQAFLDLTCQEALYGGAAGGGKSEALLMAALQYMHVPGYAALILRKDTQRLQLAGGLIPRSHEWFAQAGAVWHGSHRRWKFPTTGEPATLTFGYLRDRTDKYRYGSSEFQFIAFDELTEFPLEDYLFLFSRLRRIQDNAAPLRMRAASNPGNIGHLWVKQRFITDEALASAAAIPAPDAPAPPAVFWNGEIGYVPARIADNPALSEAEYRKSLSHLPPLLRERLMHGDWSVQELGEIRGEWLRYYTLDGERLTPLDAHKRPQESISPHPRGRFVTIDPAGTAAERIRGGRERSWTVVQVWEQPAGAWRRLLFLRDQARVRVGFDGLCKLLEATYAQWRPRKMWIENEKLGQAAVDLLSGRMPLECVPTRGRDKIARAACLINRLQRGEIFLPLAELGWRPELEAEWLAWTGRDDEPSDQIDAAAYAALLADPSSAGPLKIEPMW